MKKDFLNEVNLVLKIQILELLLLQLLMEKKL